MNTWEKLSSVNVNEHVKTKGTQKYLSWAWAWGVTKEIYPSMTYSVKDFDGKPYCFDENLGYMVQTEVTIDGESLPMHLFVMDGANKAQKHVDYEYSTKYGNKTCLAASMFDVNTAIMRCLVKNLALFGLGHYIYAGEDLPKEKELTMEDYRELWINVKDRREFEALWHTTPEAIRNVLLELIEELAIKYPKPIKLEVAA